ncbi:hypothetical protein LINPERPRIM_LOCUS10003 [Linum perenne]
MIPCWQLLQQRRGGGNGGEPTNGCRRWHPPEAGIIKVNVDAALFGTDRKFGVGLVARDNTGGMVEFKQLLFAGLYPRLMKRKHEGCWRRLSGVGRCGGIG